MLFDDFLFHYNYFLSLEKDLGETMRYVRFHHENKNTDSDEFSKIMLLAGSEVDVVCELLCRELGEMSVDGMYNYVKIFLEKIPDIATLGFAIKGSGSHMGGLPWETMSIDKNAVCQNLDWWRAYNRIKHHRNKHYKLANLENTLATMGALYIILRKLMLFVTDHNQNQISEKAIFDLAEPNYFLKTLRTRNGFAEYIKPL